MLVLILELFPVFAITCPELSCEVFSDTSICAIRGISQTSINIDGCGSVLTHCAFSDIVSQSSASIVLFCSDYDNPFADIEAIAEDITANASVYRTQKLTVPHMAQCSSDEDCPLENGEHGTCKCSTLSGVAFCDLNYGDDLLEDIFTYAANKDYAKLGYYLAFKNAFTVFVGYLPCAAHLYEQELYQNYLHQVSVSVGHLNSAAYLPLALIYVLT